MARIPTQKVVSIRVHPRNPRKKLLCSLRFLLWEYRIEAMPGAKYPPAFLLQADDDPTVNPLDAVAIYTALKQAGTSAELHLFRRGGHGFGIRDAQGPVARWPALCADWLKEIGVLR